MTAHTTIEAAPGAASDYDLVFKELSLLASMIDTAADTEEMMDRTIEKAERAHTGLVERSLLAPAPTKGERQAQLRILMAEVMPDTWRGADDELDWEIAMARRLLNSWAGLDPMCDPLD